MVRLFLMVIVLLSSSMSFAKQRDFHAFAAFGTNYSFPGSVRLGYTDWEVGMLTSSFYGFDKIFDLTEHTYATFGLGVASTVGFYAAIGFSYSWWQIGVRGELTSTFDAAGFSQGLGILGVTYGF